MKELAKVKKDFFFYFFLFIIYIVFTRIYSCFFCLFVIFNIIIFYNMSVALMQYLEKRSDVVYGRVGGNVFTVVFIIALDNMLVFSQKVSIFFLAVHTHISVPVAGHLVLLIPLEPEFSSRL